MMRFALLILFNIILTIGVETLMAVILKIRNKWDLLIIALINVCTNLCVNILYLATQFLISDYIIIYICLGILEVLVVFAEAYLFKKNLSQNRNYLVVSLVLNSSSLIIGFLIHYFLLTPLLSLL